MSVITPFFNKICWYFSVAIFSKKSTHTHTHWKLWIIFFSITWFQFQMDTANCLKLTISKREMSSKKNKRLQLKPIFKGGYDDSPNCDPQCLSHLHLNKNNLMFLRESLLSYIWTIFSFPGVDYPLFGRQYMNNYLIFHVNVMFSFISQKEALFWPHFVEEWELFKRCRRKREVGQFVGKKFRSA